MKKIINILFLGGAKRVSLAEKLKDAGRRRGIAINIFSHELGPCEPIASVGKVIVGNKYSDPRILDELGEVIRSNDIDIVLPFIDPSIEIARLCADRYGVFSPVSDAALASSMFDKVDGAALFEANSLPIPDTYRTLDEIVYPAIFKPRRGSASKGIMIVRSVDEASRIADRDNYLVQQYIGNNEEYTLDCYVGMNDNEIKCIVPRVRLATVGGEVSKTRTCRDLRLISLGERVIKSLGFKGCVTLQFLKDLDTGEYKLMEINPRLGGGVICSICAGADIPGMIIDEFCGDTAHRVTDWSDGALMTRYMQEVMFYE